VLASGGDDATVRLWDVERGSEIAILTGHTDLVLGLRFTPDGESLASAGEDGTLRLWDVGERTAVGNPLTTASTSFVTDLAQSPSGLLLATVQDRDVLLWDVDEASWLQAACRITNRSFTAQEVDQFMDGQEPVDACP
jgi:WD40 repeat protein